MTQKDSEQGDCPYAVGLCPVHREEFWFPMDTADPQRCPQPRCEHWLDVYIQIERVISYKSPGYRSCVKATIPRLRT